MQKFIQQLLEMQKVLIEKGVVPLSFGTVLTNLLLTFVLVLVATYVYRKTHSGVAYTQSFNFAMVMIGLIICMVMMTIQSNIALSIGLVGSLSVIRFRAVIRDTRDMAFLFLAIAIGLACGSFNYRLAIGGTLVISVLCLVTQRLRFSATSSAEYVVIFRGPGSAESRAGTEDALRPLVRWYRLRSMHETGEGRTEYTYLVAFRRGEAPERLAEALRAVDDIEQVSILSPDNDLDI